MNTIFNYRSNIEEISFLISKRIYFTGKTICLQVKLFQKVVDLYMYPRSLYYINKTLFELLQYFYIANID